MEGPRLGAIFIEALGRDLDGTDHELDALLSRMLDDARRAWPSVDVPPDTFVRHLADRLGDGGVSELPALRAPDLYLCSGCALGLPAALEALETRYLAAAPAIARRASASVDVEELMQGLRESLFVGRTGAPPKILAYSGRGELSGWLRVVTTRAALNAATRGPRETPAADDDGLLAGAGETESPELTYFRAHYDAEVKAVLPAALASLAPRQRLLLRQRYVDQLTIEEMSGVHGVHGATIKRQVAQARDALHEGLRDSLRERLGLTPSEFASVLALIRSRFRVTLGRLLPPDAPDE